MNDPPNRDGLPDTPADIPPTEKPRKSVDQDLERLEEDTLDKQARSASFRDVLERKNHLDSLNRRIDVLQNKLDLREADLHAALPRIAELEQAEKTSKIATVVEAIGAGGGAVLLGIASFATNDALKFAFLGAGVAASAVAIFCKALFALFGWPPRKNPGPQGQ